MVSRPNWKGHLKLSLVSCAVALHTATTEREKVAFHMINRKTGNRLKRLLVDAESGEPVEADEQAKGFEVSKGEYVLFEGGELDDVALESTHTIDIDGFVPRSDISDVYLDTPYYMVPNEKVGEDAFAVIRDAMSKRGMAGLARVVLYRRERVVMLEPHEKGIIATTLRYPYEIKDEHEFFAPISSSNISAEMLQLAEHIIDTKKQTFDPTRFKDRYEEAVKELVAVKTRGRKPSASKPDAAPSNVVDLMEALRLSVAGPAGSAKGPRQSVKAAPPAKQAARPTVHTATSNRTAAPAAQKRRKVG